MELTAEPLGDRDPDGVGVLGREDMAALSLDSGDYVRVHGHGGEPAVAQVLPSDGVEPGHVRLDELLRQTAGIDPGDTVSVERVPVESADSVRVALPERFAVEAHLDLVLRDELISRAVVEGQVVPVTLGGRDADEERTVPVRVTATTPTDTVVVRDWTSISIDPEPAAGLPPMVDPPGGRQVTYADVGGLDAAVTRLRETVELPLRHPELFARLGVDTPRGVLLYGPPGTGKTLVTRALATETDSHVETVSGPTVASMHPDAATDRLQEAFETAADNAPAVVLVDDLDALVGDRGTTSEALAGLLALLDSRTAGDRTMVVGATTRPAALDAALRRPGRFDREIEISVPDRDDRREILAIHTRGVPLADDVDLDHLAERTHGFVGADLAALVREAAVRALDRNGVAPDETAEPAALAGLSVTAADVEAALHTTEPSALREVFVEVPDVTWDDVGGLAATKQRLQEAVQWPLEHPDAFDRVALRPPTGVLLYGPPGTGKTLLAKVVANEASSNFISVKGPELLDKYVGESEKGVREVFEKARANAPAVVFFDEIDALAAERGGTSGDSGVGERVVSQLLTELDGLEELEDVVVIATTNRRDLLDDALLRAGRFDQHVHVGTPDRDGRREIFGVHTRDRPLADDVDLETLAARTDGYVGADIEAVCREAATAAVREYVDGTVTHTDDLYLTAAHFDTAIDAVETDRRQDGSDAVDW